MRVVMKHLLVNVALQPRSVPVRRARIALAEIGFNLVKRNTHAGGAFRASKPAAGAVRRRRANRRAALPANALKQ